MNLISSVAACLLSILIFRNILQTFQICIISSHKETYGLWDNRGGGGGANSIGRVQMPSQKSITAELIIGLMTVQMNSFKSRNGYSSLFCARWMMIDNPLGITPCASLCLSFMCAFPCSFRLAEEINSLEGRREPADVPARLHRRVSVTRQVEYQ